MTPRLVAVTGLALVAAVGAVAIGGVPLLAGLGLVAALGLAALPGGSRRYLVRRLVQVGGSVFIAMAIVWLLVHNYPDASRQDETGVAAAMTRYIAWIGDVAAGELGDSQYSETVGAGLSRTIPISLQLLAYSQVMAIVIAVPGALLGARFRGRSADVGFRAVGLLGLAAPTFVTGPLLVFLLAVGELNVFGVTIGAQVLPSGRYVPLGRGVGDHLASVALPSFTLALTTAATYLVLLRSEMLLQLQSEHVQLARSKGLPPFRIIRAHAMRPAAPTMVAAIGAQSALVLGHLVIVERIFLIPGFGDYVLIAIGRRDVAAVAGALFVTSVIVGVVNLFADALLLVVDPRIDR